MLVVTGLQSTAGGVYVGLIGSGYQDPGWVVKITIWPIIGIGIVKGFGRASERTGA